MNIKSSFKLIIFLAFITFIFTGCVPMKKMIYFQADTKAADTSDYRYFSKAPFQAYRVKPGNYLFIDIRTSMEEDAKYEKLFNLNNNTNVTSAANNSNLYLVSYLVDADGNIDLPTIGKIFVLGKTEEDIKKYLTEKIQEYVPNAVVNVKLVNFKVTVLGEVKKPGVLYVYDDKISVFEVLAQSGDVDTWGKRNKILLIRQTEKGQEIHKLDILKDDFVSSEFFYLRPNDMVYVQPMKGKQWGFAAFPYAFVFSSISFFLALWAVFK